MVNKIDKKTIFIIGGIIAIVVIIAINFSNNDEEVIIENVEKSYETEKEIKENNQIIVHITGCVRNNGIIKAEQGARMSDIIELAGGITEEADITKVNLAYVVKDAQKIYIPSIYDEEEVEYITKENGDNVIVDNNEKGEKNVVNINTATQTELETLSGIGPSTALKIINYREENGKFNSIEDIKQVPGIGEAKFNNIKEMLEV